MVQCKSSGVADTLFIHDLRVDCLIGRAEWERLVRQTVRIDLAMRCDVRLAARTDEVGDGVVNTKAVSKRVIAFVEQSHYQLIETLAEKLAECLVGEFDLPRLRLRLSKPGALRGAQDVGVVIVRRRSDYP